MDTQMPDGANLRTTRLSRELLLMTIKCGRPGKGMPAFDRLAYSDGRCYNMKAADLKSKDLQMPDPPATLQVREMERIVDFLQAKVVGQGPMTRAKCVEYLGLGGRGVQGASVDRRMFCTTTGVVQAFRPAVTLRF